MRLGDIHQRQKAPAALLECDHENSVAILQGRDSQDSGVKFTTVMKKKHANEHK
jgi:hypothetical protein